MKFYKLLELKKENIDFSQFEEEYKKYVTKMKDNIPEPKENKFRDYYLYEHIWVTAEDKQTKIDGGLILRANVLIRIYNYSYLQDASKIEFREQCNKIMTDCEPSSGIKSIRKGLSRRVSMFTRKGGQKTQKSKTNRMKNLK